MHASHIPLCFYVPSPFPQPHLRFLFALSDVKKQGMLFAFESFPNAVTSSKSKRTEEKANFFQKIEGNGGGVRAIERKKIFPFCVLRMTQDLKSKVSVCTYT
jgi:hypothetical protein